MIPNFENKEDLFTWLKANKSIVLQAKKAMIKHADSVDYVIEESVNKSTPDVPAVEGDNLQVKAVINTTNIMDSHDDVHLPNLWNKSLNENKNLYLLQEHQMKFDKVISDNVTASAVNVSWDKLGQPYEGKTQALIFDAQVNKDMNPYMFEQYKKGRVKNHSVGMQYVKIQMAVNSTDKYFAEEKAVWDKYYPEIVNQSQADQRGYFFAVTEAKLIEGSAVLVGSNRATPTMSVSEPSKDTPIENTQEPSNDTQKIDWKFILNQIPKH